MQHLDPELLSLLALDEGTGTEAEREHLRSCTACSGEYEVLRRTVGVARTRPQPEALQSPGPHVWAAIHRELGLDEALAGDPLGGTARDIRSAPRHRPGRAGGTSGGRPRRLWLLAAAAAVVLVLGIGWAATRQAQAPAPVAVAALEPLERFTATGSAEVVQAGTEERELVVSLSADEAAGYQEVWLLKPDLSGLVSLGVLESTQGTFAIPPGLDLAEYPVVDVSDEPLDGEPAHSGVSIVRGKLDV